MQKHYSEYAPVHYVKAYESFQTLFTIHPDTQCWEWTGPTTDKGYGLFSGCGFNLAHRWSAHFFISPLEANDCVCHTCDNPRCVNPDHLWVGTKTDNAKDMFRKGRNWQNKMTHCKHGHPFTEDNLRHTNQGKRLCKICAVNRQRAYRARIALERSSG